MGFDALFLMRLDYRDKQQRIDSKRMEFIQKGTFFNTKTNKDLFTNILYDTYCTPTGLCFDDKCSDEPIMDDPSLNGLNVAKKVDDFAKYVLTQAKAYQSNHILVPMGCDFQFQNAYHNFVNLDKLIYHVNRLRKDINVIYSTPSCYTFAVNKEGKKYTIKHDDLFPYASGPNSYWTGYFTSRPSLKGFVRLSNKIFQISKQLQVISQQKSVALNKKIQFMAMKMGVLQHHDAVAGTEKQHVAFDYEQRLDDGVRNCESVINSSLSKLISKETVNYNFVLCNLNNISYCSVTDNMTYDKQVTILLYNPLGTTVYNWNSIPVTLSKGDSYQITNSAGKKLPFQLNPITNRTKNIPERPKDSMANYNLIFNTKLPPMGYSSFSMQKLKTSDMLSKKSVVKDNSYKGFVIVENNLLKLTYTNGMLTNIFNIKSHIYINITQDLRYYLSYQGSGQKSGAYIFRPTTNESISLTQTPKLTILKGNLMTEIHQEFSEWGTLVTRLYNDSNKLETEWTVGPIPVDDKKGREIVLQYQTDFSSEKSFFTDSNGRQTINRQINYRYDYKFDQTEEVAGNMYPVNSHVFLVDFQNKNRRGLVIYVDRAQGVTAYRNGMIEIMLHRRTLYDDNFGVAEPLNELGSNKKGLIVRGKHVISFDFLDTLLNEIKVEDLKLFNNPLLLLSRNSNKSIISDFSAINSELPKGIHVLSLENHFNLNDEIDYQIMRFENILDLPGKSISIDIKKIFKFLVIDNIVELNLSANQYLKNVNRLKWNTGEDEEHKFSIIDDSNISLHPGQIRTFKVNLNLINHN